MITHVAIRRNSTVYSLPRPNRHHHLFAIMPVVASRENDIQGFLDDTGRFLSREEALVHAMSCNQVLPRRLGGYVGLKLFSEDLW